MVSHADQPATKRPAAATRVGEKAASIAEAPGPAGFLPELLKPATLLTLLVAAELLGVVLALAAQTPQRPFWPHLGALTLHIQWTVLAGAGLLGLLRTRLHRLSPGLAGLCAWLLLLGVTAAVTLTGGVLLDVAPATRLPRLGRDLAIAAIVSAAALRYLYIQHAANVRLRAQARAQLALLQARMRPHFLFNSLNTIAALTATDPARAEAATLALSDLLRASLAAGEAPVPLPMELALCESYLDLERLRLGARLKVVWELADTPAELRLAPLSLQPLLENAVRHGIEPLRGGGVVEVKGGCQDGAWSFQVSNPLPAPEADTGGVQMALENVRLRLSALHGIRASLECSAADGRYVARLRIALG